MVGGPRGVRRLWSVGSARFARDVCASVLATGVATLAFSQLAHEPAPPTKASAPGKSVERLTWEVEDVPTRLTRTYDAVAMFAMPQVEASPWSEPLPQAAAAAERISAPTRTALLNQAEREAPRRAVAVPPSRPAFPPVAVASLPVVAAVQRADAKGGFEVLGWEVPGSQLVAAVPAGGHHVLRTMAALGDKVVGAGTVLAETVGLK